MQLKTELILLFLLVALIPASLLAANSAFAVFKLQEQISNLYHGILVIIVDLGKGQSSLLQMKSNILNHIMTTDSDEMNEIRTRISDNEEVFSDVLANYKEISDFPLQVDIMKRRGLDQMIIDDHKFITQVRLEWIDYKATKDNILALSGQNLNSEAAAIAFGEANEKFDRLTASYQKTIDLNSEIARVLNEESTYVAQIALAYGVIAFAGSIGAAVAVAVFLSKRLTSPIAKMQEKARKEMDVFLAESSAMQKHRPSNGDNDGGGSNDDKKPSISFAASLEEEAQRSVVKNDNYSTIPKEQEKTFDEILLSKQLILLHSGIYEKVQAAGNHDNDDDKSSSSYSSSLLDSIISVGGHNSSANLHNRLVVITTKRSNLHQKVQGSKGVSVYLLSTSAQAPLSMSVGGAVVISLAHTSLILEAIQRTLQENQYVTIILDNASVLIHTLGLQKTFSLLGYISETIQQHPNSRLVVLVNKKAHNPQELQSFANIFNVFIE